MNPSSGERAPLASMSRSESSREVSGICSSRSTPSGLGPVRSTSLPPCGAIRLAVSTTVMPPPPPPPAPSRGGNHVSPASPLLLLPRSPRLRRGPRPGEPPGSPQPPPRGSSRSHLVRDETELLELGEHERGTLFRSVQLRVEHELRVLGLLVGVGDAGELRDLSGEGLLVEALHVPARAFLDRGLHVDLDEGPELLDHGTRGAPGLVVG